MTRKNTRSSQETPDVLQSLDTFFEKHSKKFFWTGLTLSFVFSLLLFSAKMSEMGDDSGYILRAYKLLKFGDYPVWQGPFYPFFLSVFMAVFGVRIMLFKFLSTFLVVGSLYFFYKALKNTIPYALLMPVFLLTAINSWVLFFSSQTFNEALYMLLQALLFFLLFRNKAILEQDFTFKKDWKAFLLIGLVLFLGGLTRNINLGAVAAIVLFFLFIGKFKSAIASVVSYGIFYSIFEVVKKMIWGNIGAQIASQGETLLLKNPYNKQEGYETFGGYIDRLVDNSMYYISNAFYSMTGLRAENAEGSGFLTLLTYALAILALILVFRKNRVLLFNVVYVGVMCLATFVVLQVFWAQWRMVGVFYPYLLLALFSALYYGLKRFRKWQILYPLVLVVLLFTGLGQTFSKAGKNIPILKANLKGDIFADYAPEWKYFMQMSQFAAEKIPADQMIASRKPEMSFIYTGREFYGIGSVPEVNRDTVLRMIRSDQTVFGVDMNALMRTNVFPRIASSLLCAVQGEDNSFTGIYQMDASKATEFFKDLAVASVSVDPKPMESMQAKANAGVVLHWTDPDLLVKKLNDYKVRFIVLNSPNLFITVHRYLSLIQIKYPNSLSTVHSIGDQQAGATLVEFSPDHLN
jgi:hypothetical protein